MDSYVMHRLPRRIVNFNAFRTKWLAMESLSAKTKPMRNLIIALAVNAGS